MPSLSAAIVVNDELVWAKNYEGPAGLDTVYVPGSIQKAVTATAVLQLVERGLVGLGEDVSTYAGFPVRHPDYPDTATTTRLLLTHQSGLDQDAPDPRDGYALEEFGEEIMDVTLPALAILHRTGSTSRRCFQAGRLSTTRTCGH